MDSPESPFINELLMRKVDEVSYLVASNAALYRPIVRLFHQRYESGETGWLWPGEVAAFVRVHHPHHPAYTDEECETHLKQLEAWGVLTSEQDVNQARTIEEFVRAARRYQISETARIIEEMLIRLGGQDGSRGSLDTTRLTRLRDALFELGRMLAGLDPRSASHDALRQVEGLWNAADDARRELREQALRYMRELEHDRMPTAADLVIFLQYKRMLRDYLDEFALGLKDFVERTRDLFEDWNQAGLDTRLALALARNERERKGDLRPEEEVRAAFEGQIRSLRGFSARGGDAEILHGRTTARVRGLVEQIERVVTERRNALNRDRDLRLLAQAFRAAGSDDDAHRLASAAFGWGTPRHMRAYNADAAAELDVDASVWLQPPWDVELRARVRGNPNFRGVIPMGDRSPQKAELRARVLELKREEAQFWDSVFRDGELVLDGLALRSSGDRSRVVRLVRDCLRAPDRHVRLSDGSRVEILPPMDPQAVAEVAAPDGFLYLRAFRLRRTESAR
ncbi:MAG: TIGR02677 family protein [Gemmatimonadetes bacterium]|nr:TIGR02677 family protein [Gemmatimonadota bacterium]